MPSNDMFEYTRNTGFSRFADVRARTGRTTRMLEEAVRLAREGRAVYVLMVNDQEAKDAQQTCNDLWKGTNHGIKCESIAAMGPHFDWNRMFVLGAHHNCVFLVDHYVIESRFHSILDMLMRFDLTEPIHIVGKDV